jgi:ABC-type amino acid transport substrate-binding protein
VVIVVAAAVLAVVLTVSLNGDQSAQQSTPESALRNYMDGVKEQNATKMVDSTDQHFDTVWRNYTIIGWDTMWSNMSNPWSRMSVTVMDDIPMTEVPTRIKTDVSNMTKAMQMGYNISIQESRFLKVTMITTNSSTDSFTETEYLLFSQVNGRWYFDMSLAYSSSDWVADRSVGSVTWYFGGSTSTPNGAFTKAYDSSGYWTFYLAYLDKSSIAYTDCQVQLSIGDTNGNGSTSTPVSIPAYRQLTIPIQQGAATGYDLSITDSSMSGFLSAGDAFTIGPINSQAGINAYQPAGTNFMVSLIYAQTGGTIAHINFTVEGSPQTGNILDLVENRSQLIVGTQVPFAPFEYQNLTSGKYEGIDMEIAQRVADELGATLVIRSMDFDPLFAAVQTGQIDMAISAIAITDEREKTVNFTIPYYMLDQAVLVKDTSSITSMNDLNGTSVIAQLGTTGSLWAQTNLVDSGRGASLTDITDVGAAVTSVQNGQKAAFIVDTPVAYAYANTASNHLKVAFVIATNENYGICIQKNQDDFRDALNKVINDMKADGSLQALLHKFNAV